MICLGCWCRGLEIEYVQILDLNILYFNFAKSNWSTVEKRCSRIVYQSLWGISTRLDVSLSSFGTIKKGSLLSSPYVGGKYKSMLPEDFVL